jgi:hypothetical protein
MAKTTARKKLPYSRAFTAQRGSTPRRYLLSGIPPSLWTAFEARAKREHIAKRQVILQAVEAWTNRLAESEEIPAAAPDRLRSARAGGPD